MTQQKINIEHELSKNSIKKLKSIINAQIWSIYLGGNESVGGGISDFDKKYISYDANEISLILFQNNFKALELAITTILEEIDNYGEYNLLQLNFHEYNKNNTFLQKIKKRIRSVSNSIFLLRTPIELFITGIDVYGIFVKDYVEKDEDFPNEEIILNINTDVILKFNTNTDLFFTIHVKSKQTILTVYWNEMPFNEYIKITRDSWGIQYGYSYKYSIE